MLSSRERATFFLSMFFFFFGLCIHFVNFVPFFYYSPSHLFARNVFSVSPLKCTIPWYIITRTIIHSHSQMMMMMSKVLFNAFYIPFFSLLLFLISSLFIHCCCCCYCCYFDFYVCARVLSWVVKYVHNKNVIEK